MTLVLGAGVDVSFVIGLCILVITVLRWFVNVVQGNTPEGTPRPQKPKPKQDRSDIENLLQELSGSKPQQKPQRGEQSTRPPKPPADRSRTKQKPGNQRPVPQRTGSAPPYEPSRPAPRVSDTHLASSNLGAQVRTHQMGNRVDAAVQKEITAAVRHDLGQGIVAASQTSERPEHPLVSLLRDPHSIRQAFLLSEILQKPKSRRH